MTGGPVSEDQLEEAITRYLEVVLPDDCVAFHIPNGARCSRSQALKLKRAGMKDGIPDRGVLYGGITYYIEAKRPKIIGVQEKGQLRPSQKKTFPEMEQAGAFIRVCYSLEDVEAALIAFGIPLKRRVFRW